MPTSRNIFLSRGASSCSLPPEATPVNKPLRSKPSQANHKVRFFFAKMKLRYPYFTKANRKSRKYMGPILLSRFDMDYSFLVLFVLPTPLSYFLLHRFFRPLTWYSSPYFVVLKTSIND